MSEGEKKREGDTETSSTSQHDDDTLVDRLICLGLSSISEGERKREGDTEMSSTSQHDEEEEPLDPKLIVEKLLSVGDDIRLQDTEIIKSRAKLPRTPMEPRPPLRSEMKKVSRSSSLSMSSLSWVLWWFRQVWGSWEPWMMENIPLPRPLSSVKGEELPKEAVFNPERSTESGNISYRFRCPSSGTFRCSSTGLVFVVTKEAELQYRIVQWDKALLQSSGRTPAGPLYNIECPERAVCELQLPHCEPDNDLALSEDRLSVAHITASGVDLMEPLRVTESHVLVRVSDLSLFGLVWRYLFKPQAVSGQVLLFCSPRTQSSQNIKVNMFLLPRNIPVDLVEKKQRSTTQFIDAPSQCSLLIDGFYSVDCPSAEKVQPQRALFDLDNEPNYHPLFQLRLPPDSVRMWVSVREQRMTERGPGAGTSGTGDRAGTFSSHSEEVWSHEVDLPEPCFGLEDPDAAPQADSRALLSSLRSVFVESVSEAVLDQLLDLLLQEQVLNTEEVDSARERPRADKARLLLDTVVRKGSSASSVLVQGFCRLDPHSELCERLQNN